MFYSTHILTKNGPFAKAWKAAIRDKKMTKREIQLIDLTDTVVNIMKPPVPISCRTHGELMLGCVRIYANKVSFLLRESTEALVIFIEKPTRTAGAAVVNELPTAVKEKAVTIPIGIEELVAIPELASFDVADMLGTDDKPALGVTEAFIPDDWFQPPGANFKETSQVQDNLNFGEITTPSAKTPGGKSDVEIDLPREAHSNMDDLITLPPGMDGEGDGLIAKLMGEESTTGETILPPGVSPGTVITEGEKSVEPVRHPAQKQIRTFDSRTQFPISTIKAMQTGQPSLRPVAHLPETDEELRIKQDQKQSAADLMLMMEPMRKRKFEFAEGLSTCDIGMEDDVDTKNDDEHRSIFGQVVGNALIKISKQYPSREGSSTTNTGAYTALMPRTPTTGGMPEPLPEPILMDEYPFPQDHQQIEIPQMDVPSDIVDPIVSARETLGDLKKIMKSKEQVTFSSLLSSKTCSRREAAAKFMDLLVLSSKGHIDLQQDGPYTEITLSKGDSFNKSLSSASALANTTPITKRSKH